MSTELKTLNGYGFDATKLGGLDAQYYAQGRAAHNLLDNSDFRNPVNQRGQTVYTGSAFTVDRWRTWNDSATITLTSDGIKGDGTDASVLYQGIELHKIKLGTAYTVAAGYSDGTISCGAGTLTTSSSVGIWNSEAQVCLLWGDSSPFMRLWHATKTIQWVVIYPGAYTADTLPAYQPKGYAAELAECQWYFERLGGTFSQLLGNAVFAKAGSKSVIISIKYSPKRLANPTLSFSNPSEYRMLQKDAVNASTISAYSITSFDNITTETPFAFFRVNLANALANDSWLILQRTDSATGAYIDVNADM